MHYIASEKTVTIIHHSFRTQISDMMFCLLIMEADFFLTPWFLNACTLLL
jgi:hypothetical protein